jgi:PBP1b-binding outer membrane lipoprotein LpoB
MQPTKLLLALTASTLLITGCTNQKTPATSAVSQAETAVNEIKFEAEKFAPTELKTTEATLAKLKADLASEDYKGVIAGVPQFNKDIAALKEIVVAKQTQEVAATQQWEALNAEVPKLVDALQARVDTLSKSPLPKGVTKETFEAAKISLESLKATWAEATAAFSEGKAMEATDKARLVQTKGKELETQLAMTPA